MEYIALIPIVIFFFVLVGGGWAMICNQRTYHDRIYLVNWIYSQQDKWRTYSRELERVSYHDHLWALILFQDPRKLYKFD